ncbi:unnamed protein product [Prunus armeniaca]|uniref:RPW8 domain-containing protein n=1 Tax=Prunus armeniaca TaxID=36596 RepID=A0A6J5Y089_PRUAR|nr:unnamed protein product [Prunus armeniaca]
MAGVETILGAAISELVVLLKKTIQKLKDCPALLKNLDATLVSLQPLIQEMENLNRYLGRPKEEIESLKTQVDAGIKCVLVISKSKKGKYILNMSHQRQLSKLDESLKGLYEKLARRQQGMGWRPCFAQG